MPELSCFAVRVSAFHSPVIGFWATITHLPMTIMINAKLRVVRVRIKLFFTEGASGLLNLVALQRGNTVCELFVTKKDAGLDLVEPGSDHETV